MEAALERTEKELSQRYRVASGLKFGADLMLYRSNDDHAFALVHVVTSPPIGRRLVTWHRGAQQVKKRVSLVHMGHRP